MTGLSKGKKTIESSKALKARVVRLEVKTENRNKESLFQDEKPKANNKNNPALDSRGSRTRKDHANT